MTGEKLKPLVIGKSAKPRCFKNLNINKLPVKWKFNSKAWMTAKIFEEYLFEFNRKLIKQNRKILLVLDNCTSHPKLKLSNIKLLFLPPNTSSLIQPLDQGIIKKFKMNYRSYFLRFLITQVDNNSLNAIKEVNILNAINWIKKSWDEVPELTIKKCFKKSGFKFNEQIDFDNDDNDGLNELIWIVHDKGLVNETEESEIFVNFDDNFDVDSNANSSEFINEIIRESQVYELDSNQSEDENEDEVNAQGEEDIEQIDDKQALLLVKKLKKYSTERQPSLFNDILNLEDKLIKIDFEKLKNQKQARITDYFHK